MRRPDLPTGGPMEFHVARTAREQYAFDDALFSVRGTVIFANFHAARVFAQQMNNKRDLAGNPEQAVAPGHINAMGLIDEVLHLVIQRYREQYPQVMQQALQALDTQFGTSAVDTTLLTFADEFPPLAVYRGEIQLPTYFAGSTEGIPNREILLEEMLMLWLANTNPAYEPFAELFNDTRLEAQTAYLDLIDGLQAFFDEQPAFGPGGESLIAVLRSPALAVPHSLAAQLEFLLQRLGGVLGSYLYRLLTSLDLIKEEEKFFLAHMAGPGGPGPVEVASFAGQEPEPEQYTPDREWMPRLVLIAKNAFVWLDQLAKKYNRPINTLDQIPDEELDALARAGITGLWLIGLWERSNASKTIKQIMGNPDAVASAYSLFDYVIAHDLGGEAAVDILRQRAWQRGMRLASDMVPNHTGIDGRWVIDHPDWFLQLDYPPYPSYNFNGPDLSWDQRVGIFLEDHYYDRSDAAVVFKRVDRFTGDTKYIYHGNDGTSMPWNDTAQINYLHPQAREAVIQTILHVARQFPVIRFDAAMTLAKKHIQRLWFPEPGSGSGIASRGEFGMSKAQFDALMPHEFWREVVDRAAVEAPDTLLLAEAFWLMENYFVRTLGMHRVYNSAFMHLLRDEDNAKYRTVMKNTLEFDPQILQRYVNFMNNPDEKTAVEQFGKDDKYFGICTLMSTLPGLPMFGHGQIEGFAEKYGMEYRRAYFEEQPDQWLIQRHEREIFPLLHKRYLFAGADNFVLYDLFEPGGNVNEDVFVYSNRFGDERALVLYHNRYASTRGWIKNSVAFSARHDHGRELIHRSLGEGLGVHNDPFCFCMFRDHSSGLEYIRSSKELCEQGLYIELGAYQRNVFLDIREVRDNEWGQYARLNAYLAGRGVPSLDEAARELFLEPIHAPFRQLVNADLYRRLIAVRTKSALPEAAVEAAIEADLLATKDAAASAARTETAEQALTPVERAQTAAPARLPVELTADTEAAATDEEASVAPVPALLDEVEQKLVALLHGINALTGANGDAAAVAATVRAELEALLKLQAIGTAEAATAPVVEPELGAGLRFVQSCLNDDHLLWGTLLTWLFTAPLGRFATAQSNATAGGQQSASLIDEWLLGRSIGDVMRQLGQDEGATWRSVALIKLLLSHQNQLDMTATSARTAQQQLAAWLGDGDMQRVLQVNRHTGILWFSKEALEQLLLLLLATSAIQLTADKTRAADALATLDIRYERVQNLLRSAEQAGYRVDAVVRPPQPKPVPSRTVGR